MRDIYPSVSLCFLLPGTCVQSRKDAKLGRLSPRYAELWEVDFVLTCKKIIIIFLRITSDAFCLHGLFMNKEADNEIYSEMGQSAKILRKQIRTKEEFNYKPNVYSAKIIILFDYSYFFAL